MPKAPVISVVTRYFNRPEGLIRVAKHLNAQTFDSFEWIIVDDHSDVAIDVSSLNIHRENLDFKVIRNDTNLGLAKSAAIGIASSRGEFIILNDDDDYLLQDGLAKLYSAIRNGYVGATGGVRKLSSCYKKSEDIPSLPPLLSDIGRRNSMTTIATLFKRSVYDLVGGIDETLPVLEDWDLWLKLLLNGDFAVVPEVIAVQEIGKQDQTLRKTHLEYASRMRNNYLRQDIKNNTLGLGFITNMPSYSTIERLDYLLERIAHVRKRWRRTTGST